jgi:hypothetical protein
MSWGMVAVGVGTAIYSGVKAHQNSEAAKKIAGDAKTERDRQNALLEKQKQEFRSMKFENPFANMENTFEDLTVNQQQAQFQAKQGSQQRADIMQNLKGAAGGSGVAGLAQALANQGQLQTQQISASIGLQESQNQLASAKGAAAVQNAEKQGDQWVQQANIDREATLLGMQMGQSTGANLAYGQAQANQMNAQIAEQQSISDGLSMVGQAAGNINFKRGGGGGGWMKGIDDSGAAFGYGNQEETGDIYNPLNK